MSKKKQVELEPVQETPYTEALGGELEQSSGGVMDNPLYNELVKEIFNTNNINVKTDLTQQEIILIDCLEVYADFFNSILLKRFLQKYKELKLSHKRKSRNELVTIFRTISSNQPQNEGGGIGRALGFGKEW